MMQRSHRTETGFTLVEVLAALLVLALSLGGIMNANAFYSRNAVYLRDKTIASWVANNKLTEASLAKSWPAVGRSNGRQDMARTDWFWERIVEKTPDEKIRRIAVRVRRDDAEPDAWLINLSAFFAAPQASVAVRPTRSAPQAGSQGGSGTSTGSSGASQGGAQNTGGGN